MVKKPEWAPHDLWAGAPLASGCWRLVCRNSDLGKVLSAYKEETQKAKQVSGDAAETYLSPITIERNLFQGTGRFQPQQANTFTGIPESTFADTVQQLAWVAFEGKRQTTVYTNSPLNLAIGSWEYLADGVLEDMLKAFTAGASRYGDLSNIRHSHTLITDPQRIAALAATDLVLQPKGGTQSGLGRLSSLMSKHFRTATQEGPDGLQRAVGLEIITPEKMERFIADLETVAEPVQIGDIGFDD